MILSSLLLWWWLIIDNGIQLKYYMWLYMINMIKYLDYVSFEIMLMDKVEYESLVWLTMIWLWGVDLTNQGFLWKDILMQYTMIKWHDIQEVRILFTILRYDDLERLKDISKRDFSLAQSELDNERCWLPIEWRWPNVLMRWGLQLLMCM